MFWLRPSFQTRDWPSQEVGKNGFMFKAQVQVVLAVLEPKN